MYSPGTSRNCPLRINRKLCNGSYTSYFNRRHRRVGHLFQGRYKAHLIENEGHYLEVSRYIHLNPVRARCVARPEEWLRSSYRGYHRSSHELPWVTYGRVLREFGRNQKNARRDYRRFVMEGVETMPPRPWHEAVSGLILGGETFVGRIQALLAGCDADRAVPALETLRPRPSLDRIVAAVAEAFNADPTTWIPGRRHDDQARAIAAYLARRKFGYRATEIATALGYASHGGVAATVRRTQNASRTLRNRIERIGKELTND